MISAKAIEICHALNNQNFKVCYKIEKKGIENESSEEDEESNKKGSCFEEDKINLNSSYPLYIHYSNSLYASIDKKIGSLNIIYNNPTLKISLRPPTISKNISI